MTIETPLQNRFPVSSGPVDLRGAIEEVRRMREFQPPQETWWDHLMKHPWIREWGGKMDRLLDGAMEQLGRFLHDIFARIQHPLAAQLPEGMRDTVSMFLTFLVTITGLYIFYLLLGWFLRRMQSERLSGGTDERVVDQSRLIDSRYHQQQAQRLAESGRYGDAVRELYLSVLCILDETAVVPFEQTRTNREYLAALSGSTALQDGFRSLAGLFEGFRYGRQFIRAEQFQHCQDNVQHMRTLMQARH